MNRHGSPSKQGWVLPAFGRLLGLLLCLVILGGGLARAEAPTVETMKAALPDYLKFGAVREMHQAKAAGTAIEAEVQDAVSII